jgi:replication fork clamp-binding protein CrfC
VILIHCYSLGTKTYPCGSRHRHHSAPWSPWISRGHALCGQAWTCIALHKQKETDGTNTFEIGYTNKQAHVSRPCACASYSALLCGRFTPWTSDRSPLRLRDLHEPLSTGQVDQTSHKLSKMLTSDQLSWYASKHNPSLSLRLRWLPSSLQKKPVSALVRYWDSWGSWGLIED